MVPLTTKLGPALERPHARAQTNLQHSPRGFEFVPENDTLASHFVVSRKARHGVRSTRSCKRHIQVTRRLASTREVGRGFAVARHRKRTKLNANVPGGSGYPMFWMHARRQVEFTQSSSCHVHNPWRCVATAHVPRTRRMVRGDLSLWPNSTPLSRCSQANDGTRVFPPGAGVVLGPTPIAASISRRSFSLDPIDGPCSGNARAVRAAAARSRPGTEAHLLLSHTLVELTPRRTIARVGPVANHVCASVQIRGDH